MDFDRGSVVSCGLAMAAGAILTIAFQQGALGVAIVTAGLVGGLLWRTGRKNEPPLALEPVALPMVLGQEAELRTKTALLDVAPVPLLRFDAAGRIEALNRAARRLFSTDTTIVKPSADLLERIARAEPGLLETVTIELGTASRTFHLAVVDIVTSDGPVRLVALVDIQPQIRAAEAAATRDLIEVLSHEIMNSLSAITSMSMSVNEALSARPNEEERLLRATEIIGNRAEGLQRFVEGYRDLARVPDPMLNDVSLSDLLQRAEQLFQGRWRSATADLKLTLPSPDVIFRGDKELLLQAVSSLLTNAVESAQLARRPAQVWLEGGVVGGNRPYIAVVDNGVGITGVSSLQIFKPFFTTKAGGRGIGLGIARQVALSHGGEISAEPRADGLCGACFRLQL